MAIGATKVRRFLAGSYPPGMAFSLYVASTSAVCVALYECDRNDGTIATSARGSFLFVALSVIPLLCLLITGWGAYFSLVRAKRISGLLAANALELAQIVVLATAVPLIFFGFAVQLPSIGYVVSQGAKMARGPLWHVTVDRRVLIVRGEFTHGLADAVEQSLTANRSVGIVVFESPGGDIAEAMRIGRDIEQSGLETGVATECSSACTYSFIAGRERILLPGGRLGFHACRKAVWYIECETKKYSTYLAASGIDEIFIRRALSVNPQDIWYPKAEELLAAHVITRTRPDGSGNLRVIPDEL